jgi:AcrR family transcriptional regulator
MATRNKKDIILHAAVYCVATYGVRGLRMDDVRQAAGVSSGLLYYHFTNRDGLLAATLDYINSAAAQSFDSESTATEDTRSRRQCIIENLTNEISETDHVRDHSIAWNEISASAVFDSALAAHLAETTRLWRERVAHEIAKAQAAGEISNKIDAHQFAIAAITFVEGSINQWITGRLAAEQARSCLSETLSCLLEAPSSSLDAPVFDRNSL